MLFTRSHHDLTNPNKFYCSCPFVVNRQKISKEDYTMYFVIYTKAEKMFRIQNGFMLLGKEMKTSQSKKKA